MFELGKFLNGAAKGGGKARKFFTDPIKISIILAVIIILIIYFIFRDIVDEDESFFHIMFRAGLFTLIAVVSVVFIHNKNLESQYEDKYSDVGGRDIVKRGVEASADDVNVSDLKNVDTATGSGESGESEKSEKGEKSGTDEKGSKSDANDGRVNVNITVNDTPKSGAFKPPK
jgi:hypothetical protein